MNNEDILRYVYTLQLEDPTKKVSSIDFSLIAEDVTGLLNITDLQFQEGNQITSHMVHTSEILEPLDFNINEFVFLTTVTNPVKRGTQPILHENVTNRFFNIVGRGHQIVVVPNVFQENPLTSLVSSALDLELYAKEDFDLIRIRTNDGALVEDRAYKGFPSLKEHPLNYKYTREFFFGSGLQGQKIELKATIKAAKLNDSDAKKGIYTISEDEDSKTINRQKFMMAPAGSFRIGIEFYKYVTETLVADDGNDQEITYLKDTGIGYYGLAEINQWTYGGSKL